MSNKKLLITLLADEWNSTKGGLSTMNRELAIQLAKHPNVIVMFFVPKCTEEDKKAASKHNIRIVEATERPGYDPLDWLSFPPRDLVTDVIIGHGVKIGRQAQVIRDYHDCSCWLQVVHTAPEELAMFKNYSGAISKGDEKQWAEVKLCTIADLVVGVGPKLYDIYSRYLSRSEKKVVNLTPGIFTELSDLKQFTQGSKKFRVLVFGRGDSEDFELKGFDIAAKAVAELNDKSYQLVFVGANSGKGEQVAEKLLEQGLSRSQLTVKGYLGNREDLATLLSTANLAVIPSRTEGFGLTALEALSAGLPFLVSQNSGFGEALQEIPSGLSWIIDSEDPEEWAQAIKGVREKGRETAVKECRELRTLYAEMYCWEKQCNELVETMLRLVNDKLETSNSEGPRPSQGARPKGSPPSSIDGTELKDKLETSNSEGLRRRPRRSGVARPKRSPPCSIDKTELKDNLQTSNRDQGARPKESQPLSIDRTELKAMKSSSSSSADQRRETFSVGHSHSADDTGEDSSFSHPNIAEQTRDDHSFGSTCETPMVSTDSEYGVKCKEPLSASTGRTNVIDLAILCCNVPEDSTEAVMNVFHDIAPTLNLSANPVFENLSPNKINGYLMKVHLKACVLVVDGKTVKDAYNNLTEQQEEYQGLLDTAVKKVEKVIILICDNFSLPPEDEKIATKAIEEKVIRREKGLIVWLKKGELSLGRGDLVKYLTSPTPQQNIQTNNLRTSQENNSCAPGSGADTYSPSSDQSQSYPLESNPPDWKQGHWNNVLNMEQPTPQASTATRSYHPLAVNVNEEPVFLRSLLRYGRISYQVEDLQIRDPTFTVPDYIDKILFQQYHDTPVTGVTIERSIQGTLQWPVDPQLIKVSKSRYKGINIADNETLMLKTRVRYGKVSFQESDVHFRHGTWQIPQNMIDSLKKEYWATPSGDLYIISDGREQLRMVVNVRNFSQARSALNKMF